MGRTHLAVAALVGAAIGVVSGLPGSDVALLAVSAGGASLLPDCDVDGTTEHSTICHAFGLLSAAPCKLINKVSGGHRHATHWLSTGLLLSVVVAAGVAFGGRDVGIGFAAFLGALAITAFSHPVGEPLKILTSIVPGRLARRFLRHEMKHILQIAAAVSTGLLAAHVMTVEPWWVLPLGFLAGYWSHSLIDSRFGRVQLFAPFSAKWVGSEARKTDGPADHLLGWLALPLAVFFVVLGFHVTVPAVAYHVHSQVAGLVSSPHPHPAIPSPASPTP